MKTWEISQYAPFQKRKMTFHGLTEDHTSMSVHFLHSGNVFSIPSLTKNNPYFEILYQKTVSRVKVAEEPEQNLTETHLFSTHASKASSHPSSAQDTHHKGLSRTQRGICLMVLVGQVIFSYSSKCCLRMGSSLVRTRRQQGGDRTRLQKCEVSCYVFLNLKKKKKKDV